MLLVTVYDSVSESYSPPITTEGRGNALRSFMDAVAQPDTQFNRHPEHFSLFKLGEFDAATGKLEVLPAPELLANAWEMVK